MRELGPFRAFSDPAVCRATACRPCPAVSWVNAGPTTIRALIAQTISLAGWRSTLCALDARVDSGVELGLPSGDHLNVARLRRTRERAASRPRDEGGSDWPCLGQGKQRPRRSGRVSFLADGGGVLDGGSDRVVPRQTSQVARPGDCGGAVCRQADVSRAVVAKSTHRPVCVAAWIPVMDSLCLTRALDLPGLVAGPRSVASVIVCSGRGPRRGESDRRLIGESARCSVLSLWRGVVPTLARAGSCDE